MLVSELDEQDDAVGRTTLHDYNAVRSATAVAGRSTRIRGMADEGSDKPYRLCEIGQSGHISMPSGS